jgi:hypothetical protein
MARASAPHCFRASDFTLSSPHDKRQSQKHSFHSQLSITHTCSVKCVQKRPRSRPSSVAQTQLEAWYAAPIAVVAPFATRLPSMVAKYA